MTTSPGILDAVAVDRLTDTVFGVASDTYAGRRVGTAGGRAAAMWLAVRLSECGAVVSTQEFPVTGVRELYATPVLRWRGQSMRHRRHFAEHVASAEAPEPRTGALAMAGEPMTGRWVLAAAADPGLVARARAAGALGCWCRAASTTTGGCRSCSPARLRTRYR